MKLNCFLFLMLLNLAVQGQPYYFPPNNNDDWETTDPASIGWCQPSIDDLYQFLDDTNSKAFIVLKDGKIVIEKYFDDFNKDSDWYWASAGKTLTAIAVGIAEQEGFLQLSDKSSLYLGEGWTSIPKDKEDLINIRHQLTMTTGLKDNVPDHSCTLASCLQYEADAGTRWAYHNAPYTLLDQVINSATGVTLNQYFANKVKNKIGMKGVFGKIEYNNVYLSNARSMARYGLLILNKGIWEQTEIVNSEYFNAMVNTSQDLIKSYGYLWWLNGKESYMVPTLQTVFDGYINPNAPADMFAAMGKNGQLINVVPSMDLVMIRMGDSPGQSLEVGVSYNDQIWENFNKIFCTITASQLPENIEVEPMIYPSPANRIVNIKLEDHIYDLMLRDFAGKRVLQKKGCTGQTTLTTNHLRAGVYFLQIQATSGEEFTQKLVIER